MKKKVMMVRDGTDGVWEAFDADAYDIDEFDVDKVYTYQYCVIESDDGEPDA